MSNKQLPADVQLPVDILKEIELKAEHEAALQFHPVYSPDQNTACRICYRNGAKEYATNAHRTEVVNGLLKTEIKHLNTVIETLKAQAGAVWVKASEFKTDAAIFRPYRRKSVHVGCDYDYGEVFIVVDEDDGLIYLDIDNEGNYLPQSDEVWNDLEILDESGTAANDLQQRYHEEKQQRVHLEKENDIITDRYNDLKAKGDNLLTVINSLWWRYSDDWTTVSRDEVMKASNEWKTREAFIPASATVTISMVNMNEVEKLKQWADKMQKALIKIVGMSVSENGLRTAIIEMKNIASAAASFGSKEEEKEVKPKEQVVIHNNSDAFRNWVSDIKGYPFALLGHSTGVWLPPGVTLQQFEKEWDEYEKANNPAKKEVKGGGN